MWEPRSFQTLPLFCLRPIAQQLPAQLPNLFHGPRLRFIGRATFGAGVIHQVGDLLQPRISVRPRSKSGVKRRSVLNFGW